jgi:hypothetical protein
VGPKLGVQTRDQARGEAVLGGADGDARRERRDGLVADVLVDEVGGAPERVHVHLGVQAESSQGLRERLSRDAVQRERDRVDGAGDPVCSRAGRLQGGGERVAGRALAVDADREA